MSEATRKLYVWPKRGFLAVAYATSSSEARTLLLEEINSDGSDGSFPATTRACEAVKCHAPQVFGYSSTAEFVPTDSGALEASELEAKNLLHAGENLYAFVEALCLDQLTDAGFEQVEAAYKVLKGCGSKMFEPKRKESR